MEKVLATASPLRDRSNEALKFRSGLRWEKYLEGQIIRLAQLLSVSRSPRRMNHPNLRAAESLQCFRKSARGGGDLGDL